MLILILIIGCGYLYIVDDDDEKNRILYIFIMIILIFMICIVHIIFVAIYDRTSFNMMRRWNKLSFEKKIEQCICNLYGSDDLDINVTKQILSFVGNETLKRNRSLIETMKVSERSKREIYVCLCW